MFKLGDRLVKESDRSQWVVVKRKTARGAAARCLDTDVIEFATDETFSLVTRAENPAMNIYLLRAYGQDYSRSVRTALSNAGIKYETRYERRDVCEFYVGRGKYDAAHAAIKDYYENPQGSSDQSCPF